MTPCEPMMTPLQPPPRMRTLPQASAERARRRGKLNEHLVASREPSVCVSRFNIVLEGDGTHAAEDALTYLLILFGSIPRYLITYLAVKLILLVV